VGNGKRALLCEKRKRPNRPGGLPEAAWIAGGGKSWKEGGFINVELIQERGKGTRIKRARISGGEERKYRLGLRKSKSPFGDPPDGTTPKKKSRSKGGFPWEGGGLDALKKGFVFGCDS